MHDYFEILGVSPDARARDIQRACRRRATLAHPDFCAEPESASRPPRNDRETAAAELVDVAVDFVDMASVVSRMQMAFFGTTR